MTYDFDKRVDRRGTGALKYDVLAERYGRDDLLPVWVADMEFETPPFIMDALRERLQHPVLGYTVTPPGYWDCVAEWIRTHHRWDVDTRWMTFIPGIVKGIGMVVNFFLHADEKVIIQPPVYHPFRITPEGNDRTVVYNPLVREADGRYRMDFEGLAAVADPGCKLLVLSNPHNPAGIVWDRETLRRLASFCRERGILVISDEIHCDMALFGHTHVPFASVSDDAAAVSITFSAPTKTFNMPGVVSSWCVIPNPVLREPFFRWLKANEFDDPTLFAPIATAAAFRHGEPWRQQMLAYVEGNILFLEQWCREHLPQIKPLRPEASYMVWLDCRGLGLTQKELNDFFVNKARLALNDGAMFGPGGEGFMRLNVAEPREMLREALQRILEAL